MKTPPPAPLIYIILYVSPVSKNIHCYINLVILGPSLSPTNCTVSSRCDLTRLRGTHPCGNLKSLDSPGSSRWPKFLWLILPSAFTLQLYGLLPSLHLADLLLTAPCLRS